CGEYEIARVDELNRTAIEARIDAVLERGRHASVIPELEALVREHPLRERLTGQLMLALYRCGRQADALEVYRQARERLGSELGIEPGPRRPSAPRSARASRRARRRPRSRPRP